jgi:hypothetical protein
MSKQDVERYIYKRKRNTRSVDEQVDIAHAMWDNGIDQDHDGLKRSEIEAALGLNLSYNVDTSLSHLEDIDIDDEFVPPGPEILVIAEWMDGGEGEIVLGEVEEAAREGIDGLIDDLEPSGAQSGAAVADGRGATTRSVVASEFDLIPSKLEQYLQATDKPVEVLNRAVEAIEEVDEVDLADSYGKIVFIHMPHRHRLSKKAMDLYEQ